MAASLTINRISNGISQMHPVLEMEMHTGSSCVNSSLCDDGAEPPRMGREGSGLSRDQSCRPAWCSFHYPFRNKANKE